MLTSLTVRDLGPIVNADMNLSKVAVITGSNGSGKTTLLDALDILLYGETVRVARKKDWYQMVRAGARRATLSCTYNGRQYSAVINAGGTVRKNPIFKPTALDKTSMGHPWDILDPSAKSVWKSVVAPPGISKEELKSTLSGFPNGIVEGVLRRAKSTLDETISALEAWRLELHRAIPKVEPPTTKVLVDGKTEVDVAQYVKYIDTYRADLKRLKQAQETSWLEYTAIKATYDRAKMEQAELEQMLAGRTAEEMAEQLEQALEDMESAIRDFEATEADLSAKLQKQELCPTCNRPWNPDAERIRADLNSVRDSMLQAKRDKADTQIQLAKVRSFKELPPEPAPPEDLSQQIRSLEKLVSAIDIYTSKVEEYDRCITRAEDLKEDRLQVQRVITLLRDPATVEKLTKDDSVDSTMKELSELAGLPQLSLVDGEPAVKMADGTFRSCSALSSAEQAIAGVVATIACAEKAGSNVLIVDEIDWVTGRYAVGLVTLLASVRDKFDNIIIATVHPAIVRGLHEATSDTAVYKLEGGVAIPVTGATQ